MSIDISQFYQVFFEESAEHLASMESLLLAVDTDSPDPDQLNAIFRAAHSIKGGSGTFGFTDMAEVTHVLETLLDRIRKGEISITHEMVDAFLQAGDVLRHLLEAHQSGEVSDSAASIEVCSKLERLTGITVDGGKSQKTNNIVGQEESRAGFQYMFQIRFPKTRTAFPSKTHLENLLGDLANLGEINNQKIGPSEVSLTLVTYATEAELREIFSFFIKPKQLSIKKMGKVGRSDVSGDDQAYGLFEQPMVMVDETENVPVKSSSDGEGFGFFVEPETLKAKVEEEQGFGFFDGTEKHFQSAEVTSEAVPANKENFRRRESDKAAAVIGDTSIRVSVSKVDNMINLVGELVITQAMLTETVSGMDPTLHERLINGLGQLERNTRDLQDSVMSVRMMPINLVFSRFQRVVRDSAAKLNKKVQLKIIGEGTELDKGLIEKVSDPLTHLVRNSLDHGIESPEERVAKGKDPQGTIVLRAAHQSGNILIEVIDDGAGLNRERILAKAREKGMVANDGMSDSEVWQLIYAPGFSTAAVITDVSGRGVGMDVVKKNIESIGGRVEVTSQFGLGSTVSIRLPLTLAILDGMSIAVGEQVYIIPLSFIVESFQPAVGDINGISGKQGQVVHVRGEYLPLISLHQIFNIPTKITDPTKGILVLLEAENKKVALFVDELVGQHQVVIKSLEGNYRKVPGVSGATIMGDGRVALIMDVGALVKMV